MPTAIFTSIRDTQNISSRVLSLQNVTDTVQDLAMLWNIIPCANFLLSDYKDADTQRNTLNVIYSATILHPMTIFIKSQH